MPSGCSLRRYVPNPSRAPYRRVMNSDAVQALVLAKARQVAEAARQQGVECTRDVRPGRMRAHARATTSHERATDFLDMPSLLMDCHAVTDVLAYDLARRVAALMRAMPDVDPFVSSVSTDAPYRNSWARSTTPAGHCYSVPCDMTINK